MISRQFIKSSLIYSIVGALPYTSGFILLFWFAAYLTPAQFGLNALYLPTMYFVQIISSFGLDMSTGVLYFDYRDDKKRLREFLGTVFIGMAILGTVTMMLFLFGGFRLFSFVFSKGDALELIPFGMFTILSGVLNGVFKTYSALLINQQRPVRFLWLNLTNFILIIGASLALLYLFPFTLYGPVLGRMIAAVITSSITILMLSKEVGLSWNSQYIKKIVSYSSPLFAYAVFGWVVSYFDRFLILRIVGDTTSVGVYDIAIKLMLGIELVLAGLSNTITPKVYNIWTKSNLRESTMEVNRYYNVLTAISLLLIPALVLILPILLPIVVKEKTYYEAFGFLAIIGAGYATRAWFFLFMAPLLFFKRTKAMPRVLLISAVFQIGFGILLISKFGLIGAVWTNFLVKLIQVILLYFESRRVFTFKLNLLKQVFLPLSYIVLTVSLELLLPAGLLWYAHLGELVAIILLVAFVYRKELLMLGDLRGKPVKT